MLFTSGRAKKNSEIKSVLFTFGIIFALGLFLLTKINIFKFLYPNFAIFVATCAGYFNLAYYVG